MRGKGDYKNGKIYKIWSLETDRIYIGSTVDTLTNRMSKHRIKYKLWKEGSCDLISSYLLFDLVGLENCKIEWVKDFPCETKKQLNKEEGRIQRLNKDLIINKYIAGRTQKEWEKEHTEEIKEYQKEYRDSHKEHLKIKFKEYRDSHKEELKIKRSQKMTCECGVIHTLKNKLRHLKSQKHQNFIKPQ